MLGGNYKNSEAADLGRTIYIKHIKPLMKEEGIGKFVAIDVGTGDYEVGIQVSEALNRLKVRRPDGALTGQKVGSRTPFYFLSPK